MPDTAMGEKQDGLNTATDKVSSTANGSCEYKWTAVDSQGGCCCIDPILNVSRECRLTQMYTRKQGFNKDMNNYKEHRTTSSSIIAPAVFPDTQPTVCQKCRIQRPPRCHHCSTCHRCILQYDHHCVWLNNCVGLGNYRHFFLTVAFLTLGCWYGVALLYRPFYEPLRQQIREHGWKYLYHHKTGILDPPPITTLMLQMCRGQLSTTDLIKLVFPLLGMVGVLQTVFLGYHIMYACSAYTTLEYKIVLEMQYQELVQNNTQWKRPKNPFSVGSALENWQETLGPLNLLLLPVYVDPSFRIDHQNIGGQAKTKAR